MIAGSVIPAALLWAAAGTGLTASLTVADRQSESDFPYRAATLVVENSASRAIEAVLLRPRGGGPGLRYRLAVPPGGKGNLSVALPALAPVQDYEVLALDAGGRDLGRSLAAITWPAELVTDDAFVDEAHAGWRGGIASWAPRPRRNALLLLVGMAAGAAAGLFVPGLLARTALVLLAAAAGTVGAGLYLVRGFDAVQAGRYQIRHYPPDGSALIESFTALSARRTTAHSRQMSGLPYPVYPDRAAAIGDDTVIEPAKRTITLTLRPGAPRIICPGSKKTASPSVRPRGTVRRQGGHLVVEADLMRQRAILVHTDSVWPAEPGFGGLRAGCPPETAESIWSVSTSRERWNLNSREARLFGYWRDKHRQADRTYLITFAGGMETDSGCRIDALELRPADATKDRSSRTAPRAGRPRP